MIGPDLSRMVTEAARAAAERAREVDLEDLWQRFIRAATSPVFFQRLQTARSNRWAGAIPTNEHPGAVFITNARPLEAVGIDGSQAYPLDRSPVQWAYVQAVAYRRGRAANLVSQFYDIGTLLASHADGCGEIEESKDELTALVNTWRTLLEMRLARTSAQLNPGCLILLDNSLLPWISVSGRSASQHLQDYLNNLVAIKPGLVAGIISSPQSRLFERLVHLAEADTIEEGIQDKREFLDQALMYHALKPGERSAIFLHGSPRNDRFQRVGAGVSFFFLRINPHEIARIEIPAWVAENPDQVDQVQASILADSCVDGYSYVLSQAHQHAKIPGDVVGPLQMIAHTQYIQAAKRIPASLSAKSTMKMG